MSVFVFWYVLGTAVWHIGALLLAYLVYGYTPQGSSSKSR